jgi:hypothetical protein
MNRFILDQDQLHKWAKNLLLFTAPALAIFFFQLSQGVNIKEALPLALFALYGLISDYLKKLK